MLKKQWITFLAIVIFLSVFFTGCEKDSNQNGNESQSSQAVALDTTTQDTVTLQGDGTITVSMNITNPEEKQAEYNLIFAPAGSFVPGEPIWSFKSYTVGADESLTVNITDLYAYMEMDPSGVFKIGMTAARLEDVNVRNPLSEIMALSFPDFETCSQGKDISLSVTDKPLTSLYPEGTLLVRIVDPENQGGYVDFLYQSTTNMTLKFGRGSAGPDFLVVFNASEFKEKGIRDAKLVITDGSNQPLSEQTELQFDENGYCKQGQYIEMKVTK